MKEIVSLQYRASASDSWQTQRLSHKGNRLTLSDKDSDMGTVYESDAELRIRAVDYAIPAQDLLVRLWYIDDTFTDIGTASNPVRVQKRGDGAMVSALFKHESISAPVHGSVIYIPIQVGSEQVFPGGSFLYIHPDSPAASFSIDGVQGVYSTLLTANTTVMIEVYDADTFRFQGMTFGGCKYVNLSQVQAKGVVVAGQYKNMSHVRLHSPLTKIDLPRVIDAQLLSIEGDLLHPVSFEHVADLSNMIIYLGSMDIKSLEVTLQNLINAGYTDVNLGIYTGNKEPQSMIDKLCNLIDNYNYILSSYWNSPELSVSYLDPDINELGYIISFEIEIAFFNSSYYTGSYYLVSHPCIKVRYDKDNRVLYGQIANFPEEILESNISNYYKIKWFRMASTCTLSVNGVAKMSISIADLQLSGHLKLSFGYNIIKTLKITGNPSIERTYTAYPRGYLREKRNAETRDKYLTNIDNVPVYVIPQYTTPW